MTTERPDNFIDAPVDVFADSTKVGGGSHGFNLVFLRSRLTTDDSREDPAIPQVIVRISPEHAKALVLLLINQLQAYEHMMEASVPISPTVREQFASRGIEWTSGGVTIGHPLTEQP